MIGCRMSLQVVIVSHRARKCGTGHLEMAQHYRFVSRCMSALTSVA